MPKTVAIACCALVLAALTWRGLAQDKTLEKEGAALTPSEEQIAFFEKEVLPILKANCFKCHGGEEKIEGGLKLTSREHVLAGGESGPAVDLADHEASVLLSAINYQGPEMPPRGKLSPEKIAVLTKWVEQGAPWTPGLEIKPVAAHKLEPPVDDEARKFWSFQSVKRPDVPAFNEPADRAWAANPIDAFILKRLTDAGLKPNPPADAAALIRRAYYDLTGLPPTPEEVQAFLADHSPEDFAKVVDRLLDSPQYGEKWGRHWLDLVRYAETNSYERDGAKPFVWRYRDYVIRAFNDDKPYDQFIREQIAGDELDEPTSESIIATGYYRLGLWQDEPVDPEAELYEDLDDLVKTTGEVYLGLTLGCCRCHSHKLDPIPHQDYYRFLAFFRNVRRYGERAHETVLDASVREIEVEANASEHAREIAAHERDLASVEQQLVRLESLVRDKFAGVDVEDFVDEANRIAVIKRYVGRGIDEDQLRHYERLTARRDKLRATPPRGQAQALCVKEHGREAPPTHVLLRGNAHAPGEEVSPGFPAVLGFADPQIQPPREGINSSGRRRALAEWIASNKNPLTARVMANRIWQFHFGRGLVRSTSNFGFQGDAPTHPELLDWLAAEFLEGGWRLKRLHKQIMLSNAYQMSSRGTAENLAKDPENNLLWRFDMRRLTAEEVRDSILAVNGSLNKKQFGPSVYVKIPDEIKAGQSQPGAGWGDSPPEEQARRTIYVHVKRSLVVPIVAAFDGPDVDATCPVRFVTTQPTQSLGMMNGQFLNEQARVLADYLRKQSAEPREQVTLALRRALQREPAADEIDRGLSLLASLQEEHNVDAGKALDFYCLVVLNLNEFMYLD